MSSEIIAPVIALALWSLVMWVWMYATRIPASVKARIRLDPTIPPGALMLGLPATVRWKADNYNHLMEQPTLFYAVALTIAFTGTGNGLNAWIAWAYVGLRIVHSLVQATTNKVAPRFLVFAVSTAMLVLLTVHATVAVFA